MAHVIQSVGPRFRRILDRRVLLPAKVIVECDDCGNPVEIEGTAATNCRQCGQFYDAMGNKIGRFRSDKDLNIEEGAQELEQYYNVGGIIHGQRLA